MKKGVRVKATLMLVTLALAAIILSAGCSPLHEPASPQEDEHGHEHGDLPYEWSAEYELPAGKYTLVFQESESDPSIIMAFLLDRGQREELDHLAHHLMEAGPQEVHPGNSFTAVDQHAYNLILNPEGTEFTFEITEGGRYIIYTEHFAWEFDMKILDKTGKEVPAENPIEHVEPHEH